MTHKNILLLAAPVFCCFIMRPIAGKANVAAPGQRTDTSIRAQDLKAYEGYYKMDDSYIHNTAAENGLVLQQMWDNQEISFEPRTAIEFANDALNFPLKFTKDKNGNATQVLAFKRDLWKKAKE
ncbi:MAG TPA: hypothetical protein VK518_08805 [Puia sp.]|nr:hypothetical protein [Puia sp.]